MLRFFPVFILSFVLFSSGYSLYSQLQSTYPVGVYMSFDEIRNKKPSGNYKLDISKRPLADIVMLGGNDYRVISHDEEIAKRFIKKKIWAIADSNGLYLNCFHQKCQIWFAKVEEDRDSLLVFSAAITYTESAAVWGTVAGLSWWSSSVISLTDVPFLTRLAMAGTAGFAIGVTTAVIRHRYQLNLLTGKLTKMKKGKS